MARRSSNEFGNLIDEGTDGSGWEFSLDFKEWDHEIFLSWLDYIDPEEEEELRDEDKYVWKDKSGADITGQCFTRSKLGNADWCRETFNMKYQLSLQFSAIVRRRITNYENWKRNNNNQSSAYPIPRSTSIAK